MRSLWHAMAVVNVRKAERKHNMKKILIVTLIAILIALLTACGNQQLYDSTWTFHEAIIYLPDGSSINGKVESWKDFDESDMIQVKMNGRTYLTHSSNVLMIAN